ncbi:glycosyl transferase [Leptospira ilyithenensis]|uniref:Glycosyl transferase n=1 Tax=Leptospira ilyithenensis TaxID=2484901 RepID=A0A4R9LV00_9LEPT|nr:glycosyl transferase [Leptospira ilyithenensis]TGN16759.1 glycosyl transferase [Leptospira ilyithenensis]
MKIYYYVSGHGFGHISRTSVILSEILKNPGLTELHLISERTSFISEANPKLIKRNSKLDVGVYQKDSLSMDTEKTKQALIEFEKSKNRLLKEESDYCKTKGIDLIITDASSLPLIIALEVGIPSVFVGNFTWDFIYRKFANQDSYFTNISDILLTEYSFATEALVLPFHCPMPPFLEKTEVGLVGRKPTLTKSEARTSFQFTDSYKYVLLSFGAYGLEGFDFHWENLPSDIKLVAYGVPGLKTDRVIVPDFCNYPDLVSACDYVLTKPGYGILSECYYADTPILYTDRGDFAEYPYLVENLQNYFLSSYISHEEISNCEFEIHFSRIDSAKGKVKVLEVPKNGEIQITNRIFEYT